jgi:hypothetical protein
MSPRGRSILAVAVAVTAALSVELSGQWLARHDLLAGILRGIDPPLLALGVFAVVTRLFAFFLFPGWVLYAAARWALAAREARARAK